MKQSVKSGPEETRESAGAQQILSYQVQANVEIIHEGEHATNGWRTNRMQRKDVDAYNQGRRKNRKETNRIQSSNRER